MRRIHLEKRNNEMYFMTLVYVEDILDKYGRGLVVDSARAAGFGEADATGLLRNANERMNMLRTQIAELVALYDFDSTLDHKIEQFKREWRKRPLRGSDSPSISPQDI